MKKNFLSRIIPPVLLFFSICALWSGARAEVVSLETVTTGPGQAAGTVRRYEVSPCEGVEDFTCYELQKAGRLVARVQWMDETHWSVERSGPGGRWQRLRGEGPLVLSLGYPVPYDWARPETVPEAFRLRVEHDGSRTPARVYDLEATVVSMTAWEGRARGWLEDGQAGALADKELRVVQISRSGRRMLLQVWAEGVPWWIYQETEYSVSRRTELTW